MKLNAGSGHITRSSKNKIIIYSVVITIIYFACFALLSTHTFSEWELWPFFESMIGVFMGAGAIAIITGIILVVQSVIESERDKRQKVFDQKLTLYSGIIEQMEELYRLKEDEDVPMIDDQERVDLFFTQLKVALLARPKTFRSFSQLINDIADDQGVVKEEATRLLLDFVVDARNDLDVQEEMSADDQQSLNESLEIAEKAASDIRKTGRATYFVGDDPFKQYLDRFLTLEGRQTAGFPKNSLEKFPSSGAKNAILSVHNFLVESYANRDGVSFDYTPRMGCSGFGLGKKRNAKFFHLRFERWPCKTISPDETEVPTIYLLKSAENGYGVPKVNGLLTAQSRHASEYFYIKLVHPEQFNAEVKGLIEASYTTRTEGSLYSEKKQKSELAAEEKQGIQEFCERT